MAVAQQLRERFVLAVLVAKATFQAPNRTTWKLLPTIRKQRCSWKTPAERPTPFSDMAIDELIDSKVSLKQCRLAVEALHAHQSKRLEKLQETELLPGKEQNIWLNVTVKKIPSGHKFKPVKMYAQMYTISLSISLFYPLLAQSFILWLILARPPYV